MNYIITNKAGKPVYATNDIIDNWKVIKALIPDASIEEWMSEQTVYGRTVTQILNENGCKVWIWNQLENDWVEQEEQTSAANPTKEQRMNHIIEYAKKVIQYPKGSQGYDPVDESNLAFQIQKYEELLAK